MKVDKESGKLVGAKIVQSPHCNDRPENTLIDMIVIHGISLPPNEFGTDCVEAFFCGKLDFDQHEYFEGIRDLHVSAHLFIKRDGSVTQFVPFHRRAWHAGVSTFQGRTGCNDFSIGIELEGTDTQPYEKIQYISLATVLQALSAAYPAITRERIVGHCDIAPGRKTDPGESFEWDYLDCLLMAASA